MITNIVMSSAYDNCHYFLLECDDGEHDLNTFSLSNSNQFMQNTSMDIINKIINDLTTNNDIICRLDDMEVEKQIMIDIFEEELQKRAKTKIRFDTTDLLERIENLITE